MSDAKVYRILGHFNVGLFFVEFGTPLKLLNWLVGCFEDLRRFSNLSTISRLRAGDNQSLKS